MAEMVLRGPKELFFGSGVRQQLGKQAALFGTRALLCCGRTALKRSGALEELRGLLEAQGVGVTVFAEVEAEPSLDMVERGRTAYHRSGCDLVIAVGGGSALDVGKAIAALAPHGEPMSHWFAGAEITGQGAPCIALPTTAGTGAEVTPNSVLTDPVTLNKASIRGHCLLPEVALVDPELTLSCPPDQTAYSGLDALTQALESYVSLGANPVSDALCELSVTRLAGALQQAVAHGADLAAREDMACGSVLAGLALASARLGLVHGLAHPLGALYHLPHGQVCGALLPYVLEYNLEAAGPKYAAVARRLAIGETGADLVTWVRRLVREVGAELDFAAAGLQEADFDRLISPTLASGSSKHNPAPLSAESVRALLARIAGGG